MVYLNFRSYSEVLLMNRKFILSNNLNIDKMKGVRVTNIYLLELIIFVKKTVACIQIQSSGD